MRQTYPALFTIPFNSATKWSLVVRHAISLSLFLFPTHHHIRRGVGVQCSFRCLLVIIQLSGPVRKIFKPHALHTCSLNSDMYIRTVGTELGEQGQPEGGLREQRRVYAGDGGLMSVTVPALRIVCWVRAVRTACASHSLYLFLYLSVC